MKVASKFYQLPLVVLSMLLLFWQPLSAQDETATYSVKFDALWSAESPHPDPNGTGTFPANAHFSPLIGAVHGTDATIWESGGMATAGVEDMAETGRTGALDSEIQAAIEAGILLSIINGPGVGISPGIATISAITATTDYPLISLVTMIAPSPDWFLGVSGLSLLENGEWAEEIVVELRSYDAGTEEGTSFSINNAPTAPQGTISLLSDHILGRFTFTRIDQDDDMDSADESSDMDSIETYNVTFDALWSAESPHPDPNGTGTFPANAHFSPLIGAVHGTDTTIWESGGMATAGVEDMAETGRTGALDSEIQAAIEAGTVLSVINGPGVGISPGIATISAITVTTDYPLISLVTMIAPSPDWFLGVSGLSLLENGEWAEEIVVELHAYDAGTEEGTGFSIGNAATTPQEEITTLSNHILGRFTFTRIDAENETENDMSSVDAESDIDSTDESSNIDKTDEEHQIFMPIGFK